MEAITIKSKTHNDAHSTNTCSASEGDVHGIRCEVRCAATVSENESEVAWRAGICGHSITEPTDLLREILPSGKLLET